MGEMWDVVDEERTASTTFVLIFEKHEVIDDKLLASFEEVEEGLLSIDGVEFEPGWFHDAKEREFTTFLG